jgi:FMN-dependent NADH-azoreductase
MRNWMPSAVASESKPPVIEPQPPYKLKQLIDLVAQRRYLFSYDGKQYGPMLNVAKAVAVYTRGSRFLEDSTITASRFDHQAPYWLELI